MVHPLCRESDDRRDQDGDGDNEPAKLADDGDHRLAGLADVTHETLALVLIPVVGALPPWGARGVTGGHLLTKVAAALIRANDTGATPLSGIEALRDPSSIRTVDEPRDNLWTGPGRAVGTPCTGLWMTWDDRDTSRLHCIDNAGTRPARSYTWATVATGRSAGCSWPAPLMRHGLRRINSSSTAVLRTARSSRYALATTVGLTPSTMRWAGQGRTVPGVMSTSWHVLRVGARYFAQVGPGDNELRDRLAARAMFISRSPPLPVAPPVASRPEVLRC
jgi:hypothetical protein